ncbi:hypothetical protein [Chryseobacterium bernardetii]|nr:hypothetical protein [Chryseobacterium bernardetii]
MKKFILQMRNPSFAFDKDLISRTVLQSALIPGDYRKAAGFGSTINN